MTISGNQHQSLTHGLNETTLGTLTSLIHPMKSSGTSKPNQKLEESTTNLTTVRLSTLVMASHPIPSATKDSVFPKRLRTPRITTTNGSQPQSWTHGHRETIPGTPMNSIHQTKWSGMSKPRAKQVEHTTNQTMARQSTPAMESHPTPSATKDSLFPKTELVLASTTTKVNKHQPSPLTTKWTMPGQAANSTSRTKLTGPTRLSKYMTDQLTTIMASILKGWHAAAADLCGAVANARRVNAQVATPPALGAQMAALVVVVTLIHGTTSTTKDGSELFFDKKYYLRKNI